MRWPDASPLPKRLTNSVVCWMTMKGAGDEHSDEFCFSQCDAILRVGSVAFPLAGNRSRRTGRSCNGFVLSLLVALSDRRWCAGADAAGSAGNLLFLCAAAFCCSRNRKNIPAQGCLADSGEQDSCE